MESELNQTEENLITLMNNDKIAYLRELINVQKKQLAKVKSKNAHSYLLGRINGLETALRELNLI